MSWVSTLPVVGAKTHDLADAVVRYSASGKVSTTPCLRELEVILRKILSLALQTYQPGLEGRWV